MSDPLRGDMRHTNESTFFGRQSKFHLSLFSDRNMEVSYLEGAKEKKGFWGWIRSFFYQPVEVHDNLSGRNITLYMNTHELASKLIKLGLDPSLVKSKIKENQLNELIIDYKTDTICGLFPANLVTKMQIKEALDFISLQKPGDLQGKIRLEDRGFLNPLTIINREGQFFLKVSDFEVSLDEVSLFVKKETLHRHNITSSEIDKIDKFFKSKMQTLEKEFEQNGAPKIYYSSTHGVSEIPFCNSHKIIVISPHQAMFETDKKLGRGSYKVVKKVVDLFSGKEFASYTIGGQGRRDSADEANLKELHILQAYQNTKKIVKFHSAVPAIQTGITDQVHVFNKFYGEGTLFDVMQNQTLSPKELITIAKQLVKGLKAIHDNHQLHRDLKPENILVEKKPSGKFKAVIADLGALTHESDTEERKVHSTTETYISPEYARALRIMNNAEKKFERFGDEGSLNALNVAKDRFKEHVTQALDVWSLGIILYELVYHKKPFNITNRNYKTQIEQIDFNLRFPGNHPLNAVIQRMLTPEANRASIDEVQALIEHL